MTNHPYAYANPANLSHHTVFVRWDWRQESYVVVVITESAREIAQLGGHRIAFTVGGSTQRISNLVELHSAAGQWFDMTDKLSRYLQAQRQLSVQEKYAQADSQNATSAENDPTAPL